MYTYDNHLQAAFRSLRDWMIQVVDISTDVDRPHWYDVVEKLNERHTAARLRRVSDRKGKRSTSERDRSNFEGERSNSEGDRGKNSRAGAA